MQEFDEKKVLETGKELSQIVLDSTVNDKSGSSFLHGYLRTLTSDEGSFSKQRAAIKLFKEENASSLYELQQLAQIQEDSSQKVQEMEKVFESFDSLLTSLKESRERLNGEIDALKKSLTTITTQLYDIQDISAKTNILSMNASIEAARAGDAGKGFRVIAEEVRKLSDTTEDSTKTIEGNIKDFTERLNKLVKENETGTESVDILKETAFKTSSLLKEIGEQASTSSRSTKETVEKITTSNDALISVSENVEEENISQIKEIADNATLNNYQLNDRVSLILEIKSVFEYLLERIDV